MPHQDNSDSLNAKFLSRGVRSFLPNSVNAEVDRRALIKRRQDILEKIAARKGYSSRDAFAVGDKVRIKSHLDGRWNKSGTIIEARPSGTTSPPASLFIRTDGGTEMIQHKSYLKWDLMQQDLDLAAAEETLSASNLEDPNRLELQPPLIEQG